MDLTNSKRTLTTASWVSVKLKKEERERSDREPSGAFQKAALLRALDPNREVLERIAHQVHNARIDGPQAAHMPRAIEVARQLSAGELSHHDLAAAIAPVPAETLIQLGKLIAAAHAASSFDLLLDIFAENQKVSPVGWLHLERVEMYPIGVERGELVFTVPLAPGETQTISHKEWSTSTQTYERIVQDYFESYSERGVAEKTDASMASENESRHSNAINFGATLSGGYGPVSLTTTLGLNSTKDDRESVKQSMQRNREVTEKASARARQEHKISVKLEEKKGTADSSFKTITNPSANAVRIDYYRMMRKWRTDLYRYGLRLTYDITIPVPGARFLARWRRLADLEAQVREPFVFTLKPTDLTDTSWPGHAATYGVGLEPPPDPSIMMTISRVMQENTSGDEVFEFIAPPGYDVSAEASGSITFWGPAGFPTFYFSRPSTLSLISGASGSGVFSAKVFGIGGGERMTVTVVRSSEYHVVIVLASAAKRKAEAFSAWQMRAWTALRDAAFAAYQEKVGRLQAERDRLYRLLIGKDTLSLRLLEREELLRLVMLWLLGPATWYSNAPSAVDATITKLADNEKAFMLGSPLPSSESPTFSGISATDWSRALLFGEIVRYIHQAIEWENLLYFLYPYYWGSETQGRDKLMFEHPDPEHQKFLRAGYARVVITVRPGFEEDFVRLMETGKFSGQNASQYQSVAQDIQNQARTSFAGVPPANPEKHARPLLYPQQRKTWQTMQTVLLAIDAFFTANGKYPNTLADLPAGTPTKDAWGHDLVYKQPGSGNDYDLISLGADGTAGGDGPDADISAAAGASLIATWFDYTPTSGIDVVVGTPPADIA
jgi:hypothetical protein